MTLEEALEEIKRLEELVRSLQGKEYGVGYSKGFSDGINSRGD